MLLEAAALSGGDVWRLLDAVKFRAPDGAAFGAVAGALRRAGQDDALLGRGSGWPLSSENGRQEEVTR